MSAFDERAHRAAQEVLPWLVNGTLGAPEAQRLHAHLRDCARCRDELALLQAVHAAGPGPAPDCDPDRAFARMLPRLDAPEAGAAAPAGVLARCRARIAANDRSWLRLGVALQACVIAVLALLLVRPGQPDSNGGAYRALGAAGPASSGIVVMFRPETPERELRRIVRDSGGRVGGGPTAGDAWLIDGGDTAAVLARLRAEPAVVLAEPLGAEGRP
jgi:anti-sigma factor RsiW